MTPPSRTKETQARYAKEYRRRLRQAALEHFGSKCSRCGITDVRVLTFNHRFGGGQVELRSRSREIRMLREIALGIRNRDIELLCFNCNIIHAIENGIKGHFASIRRKSGKVRIPNPYSDDL